MPIKDHNESYRHFNGVRYTCFCDLGVGEAFLAAESLRNAGISVRIAHMHDGSAMRRLFVRVTDLKEAANEWATAQLKIAEHQDARLAPTLKVGKLPARIR